MRFKNIITLLLCALLLVACNPFASSAPPVPAEAVVYASSADAASNIDLLIDSLDRNIQTMVAQQGYGIEIQETYTTTLTLDDVVSYYNAEMPGQGWEQVSGNTTELTGRVLLTYRRDDALFIVGIIDISKYAEDQVLLYTLLADS